MDSIIIVVLGFVIVIGILIVGVVVRFLRLRLF